MKYSVIDISSSGLSMIVAEDRGAGAEIVYRDRTGLSLLYYFEGKRLSARGIDKLVDAISTAKDKCDNLGVDMCWLISTAALRNISNGDEIAQAVYGRVGMPVNFLDGVSEAYFDYLANERYADRGRSLLVDLGGKSMEICDLSEDGEQGILCLDFGLLDLQSKFVARIQPSEEEADDIKKYVKKRFDKADLPTDGVYDTVVLVGATNNALYDIYADVSDADEEEGERVIERKRFGKLVKRLLCGSDRSRLILSHAPERMGMIVPAAITLKVLFKRLGVDRAIVSDTGVKEGYLDAVLRGSETGLYYDFSKGGSDGSARTPRPQVKRAGAGDKTRAKKGKSEGKENDTEVTR